MLTNVIIVLIIAAIIAGAAAKLIFDRKKGAPCSGCPYSGLGNQSCHCADQSTCCPVSEGGQKAARGDLYP